MPVRHAHAAISPLVADGELALGRFLQRLVNQIADGQQLHFNPEASLFKTGESTAPLETGWRMPPTA
jgi:hypothetical protein